MAKTRFRIGSWVKGFKLLQPVTIPSADRGRKDAWVCQTPDGKTQIIKTCDLKRRRLPYRSQKDLAASYTYRVYKYKCRSRNQYWDLTLKEVSSFIFEPCIYCGAKPANKAKGLAPTNGMDRKNNKKGYTKSNIVPCCARCNAIKSSYLTHTEMKIMMQALTFFKKNRGKKSPPPKD